MSTSAEQTYTPEDLLTMPDGEKKYELVDGHLVERNTSVESSWVEGALYYILTGFVRNLNLGWTWTSSMGYACFPSSTRKVRFPDVTFVRKERLPNGLPSHSGYIYIPPDLAVEVVSPNDTANEVENKVVEFQSVGVSLVWVIFPESRTAYVHRGDGSVTRLREDGELTGEDLLPGFRCRLGDIFPEKPAGENGQG
jgi:Uma2 family endonuclease